MAVARHNEHVFSLFKKVKKMIKLNLFSQVIVVGIAALLSISPVLAQTPPSSAPQNNPALPNTNHPALVNPHDPTGVNSNLP